MTRLTSVADRLALLADMPPPREAVLPLALAGGRVLAQPVFAREDAPQAPVALRRGVAVSSLETVGASASSPVPLTCAVSVDAGQVLPPGCNAVARPDSIDLAGPVAVAVDTVAAGEGARLRGHDVRRGTLLAAAGRVVTPALALALARVGIADVTVTDPRIILALDETPEAAWVRAAVTALCGETSEPPPGAPVDVEIVWADDEPRLALNPGDSGWLARTGTRLTIALPRRFDGAVAAMLALGLPALTSVGGRVLPPVTRPLERKVVSAVGTTDLVLVTASADRWLPFGPGTVTLESLAGADGFALVGPDREGYAAGEPLAAVPLPNGLP